MKKFIIIVGILTIILGVVLPKKSEVIDSKPTIEEIIKDTEINMHNVIRLNQAKWQNHKHIKTIWDTTATHINIDYYFEVVENQTEPHLIKLKLDKEGTLIDLKVKPFNQ